MLAVLVGVVLVWPALSRGALPGQGGDLIGSVWFFWFVGHCLTTGASPAHTDLFFHPDGKDVLGSTGLHFVDALLSLPLQVLPHPHWYTAWLLVVLASSAAAVHWALRPVLSDRWGLGLASVLAATSPFVLLELAEGRPTQAWLVPLALALGGWLRLREGPRWAVFTGLMVALTGWTYWFYGYFLGLALVAHTAWEGVRHRDVAWLRQVGLAGGVCLLAVSPAVWLMASQDQLPLHELRALAPLDRMEPLTLGLNSRSVRLLWTPWPWLFGLGLWRAPGPLRVIGLVGGLIALGPALDLRPLGPLLPLPWYGALDALPFFWRLLFPHRAVVLAVLAASAGLGVVLSRVGRHQHWLAALLLALSLGSSQRVQLLPLPVEEALLPAAYAWLSTQPASAIVTLPLGETQSAALWQTWHGRPLTGGMAENVPGLTPAAYQARLSTSAYQALAAPAEAAELDIPALTAQGVGWVVLHKELVGAWTPLGGRPTSQRERMQQVRALTRALERLLGPPVAADDRVVVYALDTAQGPATGLLAPTPDNVVRTRPPLR